LACLSSVTRFVWSGDQLLWERKSAEGTAAYVGESSGLVSYTHAGGIDRPLAIWKAEVGTIVTHQNWRGQFSRGTFGAGSRAGQSSDCPGSPPTNGCIPVPWPGWNTTAWHEGIGSPNTTGYEHYWMGSLATGMRDASGQLYMRNRYYDPQTGQFTQPDPIGLAGGLNSYGFAAGDPVSYSDPYGLSAQKCPPTCDNPSVVGALTHYLRGSGRDLTMDFGRVNTSALDVEALPAIQAAISGAPDDAVRRVQINTATEYSVPGSQHYLLGRHNLRVQGTLTTVCDRGECAWDFQGTVQSASGADRYNMNRSTGRSGTAEGATTAGRAASRAAGGKPFNILLPGSQVVSDGGEFKRSQN
jgi:RHS repeat-associated protein